MIDNITTNLPVGNLYQNDVFVTLPNGLTLKMDLYMRHVMDGLKHFDKDTEFKFRHINNEEISLTEVNALIELNYITNRRS